MFPVVFQLYLLRNHHHHHHSCDILATMQSVRSSTSVSSVTSRSRSSIPSTSRQTSSKFTKARLPTASTTNSQTRTSHTRRPNTSATSTTNVNYQEIIVAVSESRGVSPIVGLAILNLSSAEAVLCQICDTQTYVRTIHKLTVFGPTEIIFASTAQGSKLHEIIDENIRLHDQDVLVTPVDRKYWNEASGFEFVINLALPDDVESLKVSMGGNYYATSCFAAVSPPSPESARSSLIVCLDLEICRTCTIENICLSVASDQVRTIPR